jgi:hypothetical protein
MLFDLGYISAHRLEGLRRYRPNMLVLGGAAEQFCRDHGLRTFKYVKPGHEDWGDERWTHWFDHDFCAVLVREWNAHQARKGIGPPKRRLGPAKLPRVTRSRAKARRTTRRRPTVKRRRSFRGLGAEPGSVPTGVWVGGAVVAGVALYKVLD